MASVLNLATTETEMITAGMLRMAIKHTTGVVHGQGWSSSRRLRSASRLLGPGEPEGDTASNGCLPEAPELFEFWGDGGGKLMGDGSCCWLRPFPAAANMTAFREPEGECLAATESLCQHDG